MAQSDSNGVMGGHKHVEGRAVAYQAISTTMQQTSDEAKAQRISGCFLPGHLSGIIGPANSGKTAFCGALARVQAAPSSGFESIAAATSSIAFVHAFDALIPNLTVEAQLQYAADLSNTRSVSAAEKAARVNDAVQLLGLEAVRRCRIGCAWQLGISAEDIRRTSIAAALVSNPGALVVDNPMGDLSHAAGNRIMHALKAVVRRGLTVVAALDGPTPSAYGLLDRVAVLLQGRLIYHGSSGSQLVTYFETQCLDVPAYGGTSLPESEWLLDVLEQPATADGQPAAMANAYAASSAAKAAGAEAVDHMADKALTAPMKRRSCCSGINPAWFTFWTLFKRRTLANLTDPAWVIVRTVDKLYFCLLIMSLYWHRASLMDPSSVANIISILWMLALLPLFYAAFFLGALVFEMPSYLRERRAGWYNSGTYLAHKLFEEIGLAVLMTLPFSCILYFPMQLHGTWTLFWLVYVVTSTIGIVFAYLLAAVCPTIEVANGLVPCIVISLLFFAGCLLRTVDIPRWWHWFSYLDPLRYAYGALMVNEYSGRLGWDATLVVYNLQNTSRWAYLGYESVFVGGMVLLLWAALAFKRTAPHYRISIALRRK